MYLKGRDHKALSIGSFTILLASMIFAVTASVDAVQPEYLSSSFVSEDNDVGGPVNLSVTFNIIDETINSIEVQSCVGGVCNLPLGMTDMGDGSTFFYLFPGNHFGTEAVNPYFHFFVNYGSGSFFEYPADPDSKEINISLVRKPVSLIINATADTESIFPGQGITITGDLRNDLEEPVIGALVNLTIDGLAVENSTTTGAAGLFEIGAVVDDEGEFTVNVTSTFEGLIGYSEFPLSVNSWPIPKISIEGDISSDPLDIPPAAGPDTYYSGSNVTLTYRIRNTGTGDAGNISVRIWTDDESFQINGSAGNLSPTERFEDQFFIPSSNTGVHVLYISAEWDQTAPFPENFTFPIWNYTYEIADRPEWTGHSVLLEMFTQTTCGPCVDVEESIDYLHNMRKDLDFQYIVYVIDDEESSLVAQGLDITFTPDLFFDKDLFRYSESAGKERDMEEIVSYIENASAVETVPLDIEFMTMDSDPTVTVSLPLEYIEDFSGILTVYKVESYSNMRNYQGIPITNRYMGVHNGYEIDDLVAGTEMNFTVEHPGLGMGLVAVISSDEGSVMNSATYHFMDEPEIYLQKNGTPLLKITTPGTDQFNITLESFHFDDDHSSTHEVRLWIEGLPSGWTFAVDGNDVGEEGLNLIFDHSIVDNEILKVGRARFWQTFPAVVSLPENISGTFNFDVMVSSGNHTYSISVLVLAYLPDGGSDWPPDMEIVDFYVIGENRNIYYYMEATGVPDNATVIARLLPCNYDGNGLCGLPKEMILVKMEDGLFRGTINDNVVDLSTYTHLTYNAWIEIEGTTFESTSSNKTVRISTLIDTSLIGDDDDSEDDGIDPLLIVISISALLFAFALAIVLFLISRKQAEEAEEVSKEEPAPSAEFEGTPADEPVKGDIAEEVAVGGIQQEPIVEEVSAGQTEPVLEDSPDQVESVEVPEPTHETTPAAEEVLAPPSPETVEAGSDMETDPLPPPTLETIENTVPESPDPIDEGMGPSEEKTV